MSDFVYNNQNISFQEVADAAKKSNLSVSDYIEKVDGLNYTVEPEDRGFFYDLYISFKQGAQRGASVDEAFDIYDQGKDISDEDLQNAIDAVEKANSLGPTNEAYNYNKDLKEAGGGAFGAMKALLKNPGFIPQFMVSSLATLGSSFLDSDEVAKTTLASASAGAATGAAIGAKTGAGAGSIFGGVGAAPGALAGAKAGAIRGFASGAIGGLVGAMETGLTLMELIQEEVGEGVELTKENVREVLSNEENFNKLKQRSAARGRNIGAIESLAFVLSAGASRAFSAKKQFRRAALAGTGIEMTGGFVGEIAGQVGAEQEIDTGEALLEAVGEIAGPGQILNTSQVLSEALKGSKYSINGEKRSKREIVDILNSETLTPEEKTKIKFSVENDAKFQEFIDQKLQDAGLESKIDPRVSEDNDRKTLVGLQKDLEKAQADAGKKGIFRVIGAETKVENIQNQINEIMDKYEGVDRRTADVRARKKAAKQVEENLADNVFEANMSFAKKHAGLYNLNIIDNLSKAEIEQQYGKEAANSNGLITPEGDIVINKDVAKTKGIIGSNTANHELLHGIIQASGKAGKIDQKLVDDFLNKIGEKNKAIVLKRIKDNYTQDYINKNKDEYFTAFSDAVENGEITFDNGIFTRVIDSVRNLLQDLGIRKVDFESADGMYNFLKDYNRSIHKGALSRGITRATGAAAAPTQTKQSRSQLVDTINDLQQSAVTKAEFQKPETFNKVFEAIQPGGAINNYIRSLQMSPEKTQETIDSVTDRLINFDPAAKRKDGTVIGPRGLGEFIMANVGFGKLDAAKKLATKAEKTKREVRADAPEAKQVADTPVETTQELADGPRILSTFDVPLQDNVNTTIIERVENLIEENPANLKERADKLVLNEIRKDLDAAIPKVTSKGVTPEYEVFIRDTFDENVKSIGVEKSRKLPWFEKKKVGRKDYKNIDPETGKVSNYRKDVFESKASKPKYIKYYTQGKPGVLRERRRALILMIAERKKDVAIDNYIEENSGNIDAVMQAKLRTASRTAELVEQELKTFDTIKFSNYFVNKTEEYFNSPANKDRKLYRNRGFAFEQVIIDLIKSYGIDPDVLELKVQINTEKGGLADVSFSLFGVRRSLELKYGETPQKATNVPMGAVSTKSLDRKNKTYVLAKDRPASYSNIDFDSMYAELLADGGPLEKYINRYNELVVLYNNGVRTVEVNGEAMPLNTEGRRLEGTEALSELDQIGDKISENIYHVLQKEKLANFNIKRTSKDGQPLVDHYEAKVGKDPVTGEEVLGVDFLEALGVGLYNVSDPTQSPLPQLPWIKDAFTINSNIYLKNSGSIGKKVNGKKVSTIIPGGSKIIRFNIQVQNSVAEVKKVSDYSVTNESSFVALLEQAASLQKPVEQINKLSKSVDNARVTKQYHSKKRGMSTFDFDETLIVEGKNFVTATKGDDVVQISSAEWPILGQKYADDGYTFDFKDFVNVRGGKEGPLLQKMKNQIKKFGPENVFVLTARQQQADTAIHGWLKSQGIDIPIQNITGLGNSTGEAKALWMLNKFEQGYNDMYFVDDALPNVEAVKNALEQLDVKSNVQQARLKFSNSMNDDFNQVLEDVTGVDAKKRFSDVKARKRGANKGKFRFFIPPSHEDFVGLLYNFIGKGEQGNRHRDFFEKALIKPLNRAYRELNSAKQAIANDYRLLRRNNPDVVNKLKQKTPDGDFTYEDAVRVYLWNKHGHTIEGLSKADQKQLSDLVNNDIALKNYAEKLNVISKQKEYVAPTPEWEVGDIRTDLIDATGRIGRAKYFTEFQENADIVFSSENLNKIEATYGIGVRNALEDVLYRVKTGTNRPSGQNALVNKLMNYLNGAVGSVMFFNVRSAILQQMSFVNFMNFGDNNIFKFAKAFANKKQYWADWAMLFNSDFMKQRRSGIQTDVNGAELAAAVAKSKNPVQALIRKLLQLGFLPTQIGDNIAIATGGATMYRNRVNTYLKQGLSKKEAETKAFEDFQEIAESTQQSARPDMVSQQQASPLGKLILAFQNVTSQYNRLGKKAMQDLINRRITPPYTDQFRSDMANANKILYYFAAQNLIFYSLQTALFAMMFDDVEEDERFLKKKERMINGSIDSVLRGAGIMGAVVSTLKNMGIKFAEQRQKGYRADESAVLMEALNVSPPLGIKARKIVNAEKTFQYNKKVIEEMPILNIDNPLWSAVTNYTEGITNVPVNRLYNKTQNVRQSLDDQHNAFHRLLMFLGWSQYNLGIENKEVEYYKDKVKKASKQARKSKKSKFPTF
jgi:hypothetical protein